MYCDQLYYCVQYYCANKVDVYYCTHFMGIVMRYSLYC